MPTSKVGSRRKVEGVLRPDRDEGLFEIVKNAPGRGGRHAPGLRSRAPLKESHYVPS